MMESYSTGEAREQFSDVINKTIYQKTRIQITRRNKPVAFIVPVEDYELLERLEDEQDIRDARQALAEFEENSQAFSLQAVKKELGLE
jgi:prevent-host-death family protein